MTRTVRGKTYEVASMAPELIRQGQLNIEMAEQDMPALLVVRRRFAATKPLKGAHIGMALHVTKETAALVRTIVAGGATVAITSCNPLSTQDDAAAALAAKGVQVFAYKGESQADYARYITMVVKTGPDIVIDDGCDLIARVHKSDCETECAKILGGCEETTTGVNRLRVMGAALKFPVIAVNDSKTKFLIDNYYGTGQSTWDGILRASATLVASKTVVIAGYGPCGSGIALRAKGLGANVVVAEVDPFRALKAHLDGYRVIPLAEAAKIGDIFVTSTGQTTVISAALMLTMKKGAILANAGHFRVELDIDGAKAKAQKVEKVRPFMDKYQFSDKHFIYILGEGRLINLSAAEGHPPAVMSCSFANQSLAVEYIWKNHKKLREGTQLVTALPSFVDNEVSRETLAGIGIKFDKLTPEQEAYAVDWEAGTVTE